MKSKTELEKQMAGEEFWNSDPQISAKKSRARALCDAYNRTTEDQKEERLRLLKEIFGTCADDIFIKPPFHCDYAVSYTHLSGCSSWTGYFLRILSV